MSDDEQSRLNEKKRQDNENEKLWENLKIDFHLESFKFPDNKIYGIIDVIPESSRKLIKKLVLVVNKTNRIEFDPNYKNLSASGFKTNRKNPSAYIEAVPNKPKWAIEPKTSKPCYFYFTGEVFALSPTINFHWPNNDKDLKANLVIKWFHIGDQNAHRYILYLDDVPIQNIRQKLIDDAFEINISGFNSGEKHTFQLAARLINGKETYRSDLMEFIVPDKSSADNESTEFITVLNELPPPDLPVIAATEEEVNQLSEQLEKEKEDNKPCICCEHSPHNTFPGMEHYFNAISQNRLVNKNKKVPPSATDDDDDVIMTNN